MIEEHRWGSLANVQAVQRLRVIHRGGAAVAVLRDPEAFPKTQPFLSGGDRGGDGPASRCWRWDRGGEIEGLGERGGVAGDVDVVKRNRASGKPGGGQCR